MKKHIIIAGVPRSGKSTISQMISKNFGYQHISMDSIIAGIEKVFPETGINSDANTDLQGYLGFFSKQYQSIAKFRFTLGTQNRIGSKLICNELLHS